MPQQKPSHNLSDSSPENHERKRPTSERKIVANRQNSSKSTGPKTERGKLHSRRNSFKHGFFARTLFVNADIGGQAEDPVEFRQLHAKLWKEWQPVGPSEEAEVEQIAGSLWRRRRLWAYENAELVLASVDVFVQTLDRGVNVFPEDRVLVNLLQSAKRQLEIDRRISDDLKAKILADKRASCLWPKFEEIARKALRDGNMPEEDAELLSIVSVNYAIRHFQLYIREARAVRRVEVERKAIPNAETLDKIVRYSAMIDKDLSRAFDRLERLQRRRKGESVPPSLNLNVNI
jgi:hypothetical protein